MHPKPCPPWNGSFLLINIIVTWNTLFILVNRLESSSRTGPWEVIEPRQGTSSPGAVFTNFSKLSLFFKDSEQNTAANTAIFRQLLLSRSWSLFLVVVPAVEWPHHGWLDCVFYRELILPLWAILIARLWGLPVVFCEQPTVLWTVALCI